MSKTFRLIIDTNFIFQDREIDAVFSSNLRHIREFINENKLSDKVSILMPAVTLEERVTQQLDLIKKVVDSTEGNLKKLKSFRVKAPKGFKKNYRKIFLINIPAITLRYRHLYMVVLMLKNTWNCIQKIRLVKRMI